MRTLNGTSLSKTIKPPKAPKPPVFTTSRCILLETSDSRKFFTPEKNFERLIEYANTFKAKVSTVIPEKSVQLLDLPELAEALSSPARQTDIPGVQLLETKIDQDAPKKKRRNLSKYTDEVQLYIRQQFLANKIVGLKELNEDFRNKDLYPAFFFKHIAKVKKDLEADGYKIEKVGTGKYRLARENHYGGYYHNYENFEKKKPAVEEAIASRMKAAKVDPWNPQEVKRKLVRNKLEEVDAILDGIPYEFDENYDPGDDRY